MNDIVPITFALPKRPTRDVSAFLRMRTDAELEAIIHAADGVHGQRTLHDIAVAVRAKRAKMAASARRRDAVCAWLDAHGVSMGDMVDVTNVAGRTFTGRLVDFRPPLGYISLTGDEHFAFSMLDAIVRRSPAEETSVFVSRHSFVSGPRYD